MKPYAVECDQVSVRLGDHRALEDVTVQAPEGAFLAIVGPNGAGKSTFLRVLLGLLSPAEGTVRTFGKPPHQIVPRWIGYVPQLKTLDRRFPALAIELVVTGLHCRWPWRYGAAVQRQAMSALERAGAGHLAERPISRLSGGELQRVYLARSVARCPKLILLDEPAAGMDISGEADMYHILEEYQAETGATVLMVTHDLETAYYHASHVLLLNRAMVSFGPPEQALQEESLRRVYEHIGHPHAMRAGRKPDA